MWVNNKKVLSTFIDNSTQWSWAEIETVGYRRIKDGAADGCSNLTLLLNAAKASGRPVSIDIDASNLITTAYLL
jgi:hypothetical protein